MEKIHGLFYSFSGRGIFCWIFLGTLHHYHHGHHQKYQCETPTMMMSMYRYVCLFTYIFMCPYRDIIIVLRTAILFGLVFFWLLRHHALHRILRKKNHPFSTLSSFFISLHTIVLVIIISILSTFLYSLLEKKAKRFSFFTEMQ